MSGMPPVRRFRRSDAKRVRLHGIYFVQPFAHKPSGATSQLPCAIFQHAAKERHTLGLLLKPYFPRMQGQVQVLLQEPADWFHIRKQMFRRPVHKIKVIHVSAIMAAAQDPLYKLIQTIQIDVTEQLRRQVSYWQPATTRRIEQTFALGQSFPVMPVPFIMATLGGLIENDLGNEIYHIGIKRFFRYFLQLLHYNLIETPPVYAHEIPKDIQFKHITRFGVILRNTPDVVFQPVNPEERPLPHPAGIGVMNEGWLKYGHEVTVQKMVHNPVAEGCCKYLPLDWAPNNEAHAASHMIAKRDDIPVQLDQIARKVLLEVHLRRGITFV